MLMLRRLNVLMSYSGSESDIEVTLKLIEAFREEQRCMEVLYAQLRTGYIYPRHVN